MKTITNDWDGLERFSFVDHLFSMMLSCDRMYKDDMQTHELMCACVINISMLGLIHPEKENLIKKILFYQYYM